MWDVSVCVGGAPCVRGASHRAHLLVLELLAVAVDHVEPTVGDCSHSSVARLEVVARQEGAVLEHLLLEHLDELELAAALELEALELGQRAVEFVDGVPVEGGGAG